MSLTTAFRSPLPERRDGSNILPSIPPEIYLEIFGYFEPSDYGLSKKESKRYFITLSQVSCWFHSYFFPLIFRSLDVSAYRSSVSTDTRLFQELDNTASPSHSQAVELAALVTECTIRIYADDQEVYMRSLKHFSSLRYLSMIDIYISGYFVESLSHLQNLETLIITRCFLSKYPTDSIFNILLPKLTSFELSYSHPALPSNLFQLVLPNLASLKLQSNLCDTLPTSLFQLLSSASQTVKSLHITSFHAAVPVTLNHVYCFLTELVLFVRPVWGTPTFGNFLKQTPTITSINFIDDPPPLPSPPLPSFGLPLSTLPSLKHIRGPDWVLMDLIPGRSVKRVELFTFNFFLFPPSCFERAVDILCCSAAGIEHLEIPLSPVVPRGIFQNVRTLSLQLNDNLKDIKPNFILDAAQLTVQTYASRSVKTLIFRSSVGTMSIYWLNLAIQYHVLTSLFGKSFPSLQCCHFSAIRWVRSANEDWFPAVLVPYRGNVQNLLRKAADSASGRNSFTINLSSTPSPSMDFNCFLRSLFRPEELTVNLNRFLDPMAQSG